MPCCAAQSRATCWLEITVLFHVVDCAIRNSKAPASRSSCKASLPQVVVLLLGGPGEKPIGNTFRPLMTSAISALTVTTEPVWPSRAEETVHAKNPPSHSSTPGTTALCFNLIHARTIAGYTLYHPPGVGQLQTLGWLGGGFGVALGWLWGPNEVPINRL